MVSMNKLFAVVVLALVLSTSFEGVAEARKVAHHHGSSSSQHRPLAKSKLAKKHLHDNEEQPVFLTICGIVGLVGGVITIVDKVAQVAEGGGCVGPRRERSDDEDMEEQPGSCDLSTRDDIVSDLTTLKNLVSKIDLTKPVVVQDGQFYVSVQDSIGSDLMSAKSTSPTKFKLSPVSSDPHKSTPTGLKRAVRDFKRMSESDLVMKKKVGSDMEEQPVFTTIVGIVGLVSGAITITDAIVRATRGNGRSRGGSGGGSGGSSGRRKGSKLEEEVGGNGEDLSTKVFNSESFWGEVSKITDGPTVEKQKALEIKALLRTLVDGLGNIDPSAVEIRDGEWTVPITIS